MFPHLTAPNPPTVLSRRGLVVKATRESEEHWLPVVGWEGGYEVSDLGRVRSLDREIVDFTSRLRRLRGRVLRPGRSADGRLSVNINRRPIRVHILVLTAFVSPRPDNHECCHYNDMPWDNRLINLRWDNRSGNGFDRVRNGTQHFSSRTHCKHGHEYTSSNTLWRYRDGSTSRVCRQCRNNRVTRWNARKVGRL